MAEAPMEENLDARPAAVTAKGEVYPVPPIGTLDDKLTEHFAQSFGVLQESFTDLADAHYEELKNFITTLTRAIQVHCMLRDMRPFTERKIHWTKREQEVLEALGGIAFITQLEENAGKRTIEAFDNSLKDLLEAKKESIIAHLSAEQTDA